LDIFLCCLSFISISQAVGCQDHFQNVVNCVGLGVELVTFEHVRIFQLLSARGRGRMGVVHECIFGMLK